MTTKSVSYAYPTSPAAVRAGRGATGCYLVEIITDNGARRLPGFSAWNDKADALAYAESLPEPWNWFSLREDGATDCCEAWLKAQQAASNAAARESLNPALS